MYSSTRFGRPHAHHQELNNCITTIDIRRRILCSYVLEVYLTTLYVAPNIDKNGRLSELEKKNLHSTFRAL